MPASVVAISVQTGSGGFAVAHRVADKLGFRYYDWEITSEAASRAGVSPNDVIAAERVPGFMERMMRRLGAVSTVSMEGGPTFTEPPPGMWSSAVQGLTQDDYRQFIERIIQELAERGNAVIVGHAGQHTLKDTAGVLKVLIHGSPRARSARLAAEQGTEYEKAAVAIKESDRDRAELFRRVYHFQGSEAGMYDLTLNTDHLSTDFTADAIVAAAEAMP